MKAAALHTASAALRRRSTTSAISHVRQSGAPLLRVSPSPNPNHGVRPAVQILGLSPHYPGYMPSRMFHGDGYPYQPEFQRGQRRDQHGVLIPEQQGLYTPEQRVIMPEQVVYKTLVIPLLPTDGMPCPQRIISPITQVSNPLVILDDKAWGLHELSMAYPLWKRITENPLVQHEAYVMHEVWRWCLRSIAGLCAATNRIDITIAPAIFKDNFRVSSRTFEASLIDPVGFHFRDERLLEILRQLGANGRGLAFAAFCQLVYDLAKEYQPEVPIPPDSNDWLRRMSTRNVCNIVEEEAIVNDPCLLQPFGRRGFTNHTDDLLRSMLPCTFDSSADENKLSRDVLMELASLQGYDGCFWGDVFVADPLFRHHYQHAYHSLPPRESRGQKMPELTEGQLVELGKRVCGVLRSGLKHSLDREVKLGLGIRERGPYTLENVIEHQHSNLPRFPGIVIKIMALYDAYGYLYMAHYFYVHPKTKWRW